MYVTLNYDLINKCNLGTADEKMKRIYLEVVNIRDIDGVRHYCGTNGHICIHAWEKIMDGDSVLDSELNFRIPTGNKIKGYQTVDLDTAKELSEDVTYPDYFKVIPKGGSFPEHFAWFDHRYLAKVEKVFGKRYLNGFKIVNDGNPEHAYLITNSIVDNIEFVIMPIRVNRD